MILSVSRRTDIPAFYSEWFFNRLNDGFLYVQNPFNTKQISKISLNKEDVECFVFWTKDPGKMINKLHLLEGYNYYFQITITSYGKEVEKSIRDKGDIILDIIKLSKIIGKNKVVIRYDPILINDKYTINYHIKAFSRLLGLLEGHVERCVISFVDLYKKTERNTRELNIKPITEDDMHIIAKEFSIIAREKNIELETCSEVIDFSRYGIAKGKCIDDRIISQIMGKEIQIKKDDTQREECGCVKSVEIGQYNSCLHNCLYCYANFNEKLVKDSYKAHNKYNPLLIGEVPEDAKITERKMKRVVKENSQLKFDL